MENQTMENMFDELASGFCLLAIQIFKPKSCELTTQSQLKICPSATNEYLWIALFAIEKCPKINLENLQDHYLAQIIV